MAEALVDDLEAVEVEEEHRDRAGLADATRREGVADAVHEQDPVRQARDHVVQRLAGEPLFGVPSLVQVALGSVEQAGVGERDRGELGEPLEGGDLAAAERPGRACRTRGR